LKITTPLTATPIVPSGVSTLSNASTGVLVISKVKSCAVTVLTPGFLAKP
jgi:hypothetical protein